MKTTLLSFLFFLVINLGYCQYAIEWQNTIGGNDNDQLRSIQQTTDGGYVLGGYSNSNISGDKTEYAFWGGAYHDYWVLKTDSVGNILWQNTIGGNNEDYLNCVKQTSDGGYILGGYSSSTIYGDKTEANFGGADYWVLKLDSIGNILWQNTIGGDNWDVLVSIEQTADGGFICGGYSNSDSSGDKTENWRGSIDYWVVKINSSGDVQWDKTIGGSSYDCLTSIHHTTDGGYILGGYSDSNISGDKAENTIGTNNFFDYWVVKLNSIGNIVWQNTIGGNNNDEMNSLVQTSDGGYVLGGTSGSNIYGDKTENCKGIQDYWVVKLSSTGVVLWQKTIGGNLIDDLNCISKTADDGFILTGESTSNQSGDKSENSNGSYDLWTVKLDSSGNIAWDKTVGGNNIEAVFSCQQTTDSGYILGAYSQSNISGDKSENSIGIMGAHDYWIIKLGNPNLINGKLFIDLNSNQIQDSTEMSISSKNVFETITGKNVFSQDNGNYRFGIFDTGSYIINPPLLNYYTAIPNNHIVNFVVNGQIDSLNDFAFQPAIVANDLQVSIIPLSPFRSGLNATYNIHYKNIGTTLLAPTVVFYPDNNLSFVSALPVQTSVTADSVVWNLSSLSPYSEGNIIVTVHVTFGLPSGSLIISNAKIESDSIDYNSIDNQDSCEIHTIGSFDPNGIIVDRDTVSPFELNPAPPYLNYVIYFQNTGNDTAFDIKVENILPLGLDANSFQLVSASHPVNLSYNPISRLMTSKFDNILLPDSNVNEPLSHGYVHYHIKPFGSLLLGDSIVNYASIYFDLNAPVQTNHARTHIEFHENYFGTEVTGNSSVCLDSILAVNYSTNFIAGNNYNWIVNSGSIISGQGSSFIEVQFLSQGYSTIIVQECDSNNIICDYDSITVTINQNQITNQSLTICGGDSILLEGSYQTQNGIYYDSLSTTYGCDSIIETLLTVNSAFVNQTLSICNGDSIFLEGNFQTQSGVYYDTLNTALGCDSIIETILSINPAVTNTVISSICDGDSILLAGIYQTQAGIYIDSLNTTLGCDSLVETNLSVNSLLSNTDTVTIVQGDSVFAGGNWQTQSGVYYDSLLTIFGCDSIITTVVNVITSLEQLKLNVFSIQPNPVKDFIEISFSKAIKDGVISISNIQGKVIKQIKTPPSLKLRINLADLAVGTYLIGVNGYLQRFVKW